MKKTIFDLSHNSKFKIIKTNVKRTPNAMSVVDEIQLVRRTCPIDNQKKEKRQTRNKNGYE
jgi:hypothetical protein